MNKTELVESVSDSSHLSKKDVQAVLDGFLATIGDSLKKGEKVALVGFGTFETVKKEARTGRNPRTGEALEIPARTVPKFSAGKSLREAIDLAVGSGES
uniref:ORF98 n=1 Tax=Leptospirillum ferrooxidans TaxID=180 RepID=Q58KH1_9BACT|nr:HU family DNA-binding protein [Leptospirillum ferrooxidans]AAX36038.1 ORF98 [Leptospirillum ferrooxidans]